MSDIFFPAYQDHLSNVGITLRPTWQAKSALQLDKTPRLGFLLQQTAVSSAHVSCSTVECGAAESCLQRENVLCMQGVFYGELFSELGLVLGSSLDPVTTNFIEPAFINDTVCPWSQHASCQALPECLVCPTCCW